MLRLSIMAFLAAGVLAFLAVREWRSRAAEAIPPQEVTLNELFARSPGDNRNVLVRGFEFDGRFAYDQKQPGEPWRAVWMPVHTPSPRTRPQESDLERGTERADADGPNVTLLPKGGEGRLPGRVQRESRAIHALVVSRQLHSAEDVKRFADQRNFQGRIVEDLSELREDDLDLLALKFPGVNLSKCLLIEVDRPPRGLWGLLLYGIGTVVSLAASGWFLRAWLRRPRAPVQRSISEEAEQAIEAWQEALDKRKPRVGGYE